MSVGSAPRQLALALDHAESFAREDFLGGPSNAAALALIESWPDWPGRAVVLVGPEGSGKSHLAAIWAADAGARFLAARARSRRPICRPRSRPARWWSRTSPPGAFDERALFHLINLAREEEAFVLLTARTAPAGWNVAIRDLGSRLKALPVVALAPPDDALLRAVLVKLFADRQLAVDESLIGFVVNRIERSFAAARAVVARLDARGDAAAAAVNQGAGRRACCAKDALTGAAGRRVMSSSRHEGRPSCESLPAFITSWIAAKPLL